MWVVSRKLRTQKGKLSPIPTYILYSTFSRLLRGHIYVCVCLKTMLWRAYHSVRWHISTQQKYVDEGIDSCNRHIQSSWNPAQGHGEGLHSMWFITRFESTCARVLILLMWSLACSISKKQAPGELGLVTRQACRSETWWSWLHLLWVGFLLALYIKC